MQPASAASGQPLRSIIWNGHCPPPRDAQGLPGRWVNMGTGPRTGRPPPHQPPLPWPAPTGQPSPGTRPPGTRLQEDSPLPPHSPHGPAAPHSQHLGTLGSLFPSRRCSPDVMSRPEELHERGAPPSLLPLVPPPHAGRPDQPSLVMALTPSDGDPAGTCNVLSWAPGPL